MSAVIGTRPRIYLACARSFCEAPNLGPTKGSRPAEWGRPTCRRPVCRCGVVAARCADGVRSGGVSGRAAALQALRCASYRPRGGCTRVYKKMLSCTVPCTRQVWTLCVILSDLNRPELCFIEWHWSLCALLTSKSAVRDPILKIEVDTQSGPPPSDLARALWRLCAVSWLLSSSVVGVQVVRH